MPVFAKTVFVFKFKTDRHVDWVPEGSQPSQRPYQKPLKHIRHKPRVFGFATNVGKGTLIIYPKQKSLLPEFIGCLTQIPHQKALSTC